MIAYGWSYRAPQIADSCFARSFSLPCNREAAWIAVKGADEMSLVHVMTEGK